MTKPGEQTFKPYKCVGPGCEVRTTTIQALRTHTAQCISYRREMARRERAKIEAGQ
jgi:hypothetical protein